MLRLHVKAEGWRKIMADFPKPDLGPNIGYRCMKICIKFYEGQLKQQICFSFILVILIH